MKPTDYADKLADKINPVGRAAFEVFLDIAEQEGFELIQPVEGMCFVGGKWHVIPNQTHFFVTGRDRDWFLEHSVACRLSGMRNCEIHKLCCELAEPPVGEGRWIVEVSDGELSFRKSEGKS